MDWVLLNLCSRKQELHVLAIYCWICVRESKRFLCVPPALREILTYPTSGKQKVSVCLPSVRFWQSCFFHPWNVEKAKDFCVLCVPFVIFPQPSFFNASTFNNRNRTTCPQFFNASTFTNRNRTTCPQFTPQFNGCPGGPDHTDAARIRIRVSASRRI